ncbi:MAG: MBL fold metallo-hydrolase [Bacillota bacterium]|nr:MBL fold metallo-hydrolase [Bacillota bacterium]
MKIKWLGHSCFLITAADGSRILTDPPVKEVGYELPPEEADILTTSHKHYDHYNIKGVKGNFVHIENPGEYEHKGIAVKGISTFHDTEGGAKRGSNTIFVFEVDGLKICHCGDLGHILTQQQISAIGNIDVLLIPVGSVFTVNYLDAAEIMEILSPKITIPMHYKTKALTFELDKVDKFLSVVDGREYTANEIEINRDNLEDYPPVVVLNYK